MRARTTQTAEVESCTFPPKWNWDFEDARPGPLRVRMGAPDDEREVRVAAKGPTDVDFERTGSAEHGALFTLAGCYLVRATLGGRMLSGARRQPG